LIEQFKVEFYIKFIDTIISTERHPKKDSISHADLSANSVLPRLCRLKRDNATSQYGFDFKTLKNEGTHVAINVREGLPAAQAGLREGDYILEVNGESVDGVEHDVVISKINAHVTMVDLLAVNDVALCNAYRQQMKRPDQADVAIELSDSRIYADRIFGKLKERKISINRTI